jgi:small-conductance mechanosensitive channel
MFSNLAPASCQHNQLLKDHREQLELLRAQYAEQRMQIIHLQGEMRAVRNLFPQMNCMLEYMSCAIATFKGRLNEYRQLYKDENEKIDV